MRKNLYSKFLLKNQKNQQNQQDHKNFFRMVFSEIVGTLSFLQPQCDDDISK